MLVWSLPLGCTVYLERFPISPERYSVLLLQTKFLKKKNKAASPWKAYSLMSGRKWAQLPALLAMLLQDWCVPPAHSGILSIVACTEFVFSKWEVLRLHILEQGKNGKAILGEDIWNERVHRVTWRTLSHGTLVCGPFALKFLACALGNSISVQSPVWLMLMLHCCTIASKNVK